MVSNKKSSVLGRARLSNKNVHLNGFDLSHRNVFTASLGQLLPVDCQEVLPSDNFSFNGSWFTRAQPLINTSFGRLKEVAQTFFVPYTALWRFASQVMLSTSAVGPNGLEESRIAMAGNGNVTKGTNLPFFYASDVYAYCFVIIKFLERCFAISPSTPIQFKTTGKDAFPLIGRDGFLRTIGIGKLLNYLGYGSFDELINPAYFTSDEMVLWDTTVKQVRTYTIRVPKSSDSILLKLQHLRSKELPLVAFRLLAYQKICRDFYRNDAWDSYDANSCNIDYVVPHTSYILSTMYTNSADSVSIYSAALTFATAADACTSLNELSDALRAFKSHFDLYILKYNFFDLWQCNLELDSVNGVLPRPQFGNSASVQVDSNEKFTIKDLRAATALQEFKEIALSNESSYASQVLAHFGVKPDDDNYRSYFVGGASSIMSIDTQVNQNLADDNNAILGGIAQAQGSYNSRYTSNTYGMLISLYSIIPIIDYDARGIDDRVCTIDVDSLPIPSFDNVGFEPRYASFVFGQDVGDPTQVYGYAPRYFDYKVGKDVYHGDVNYTLDYYIMASNKWLQTSSDLSSYVNLLRVSPDMTDTIFANNKHQVISDDQFVVNYQCGIPCVRPLSIHSLPFAN